MEKKPFTLPKDCTAEKARELIAAYLGSLERTLGDYERGIDDRDRIIDGLKARLQAKETENADLRKSLRNKREDYIALNTRHADIEQLTALNAELDRWRAVLGAIGTTLERLLVAYRPKAKTALCLRETIPTDDAGDIHLNTEAFLHATTGIQKPEPTDTERAAQLSRVQELKKKWQADQPAEGETTEGSQADALTAPEVDDRTCAVPWCTARRACKGYCTKHYSRLIATGDPYLTKRSADGTASCGHHPYRETGPDTYEPVSHISREIEHTEEPHV